MKRTFGYIRVSAKDQKPERQYAAFEECQIPKKRIFLDKQSGKDFDRPAYQKLLKEMCAGDLLVIKSIDRLGRNYREILEQWRIITKDIGADIQVLDMPLLNTNSFQEDLTGIFISDLVLQILAYVAETERSFIKQRQAEGIATAKANGVQFGCSRIEMPEEFEKYCRMWHKGEISIRNAAKKLGISYSTFFRRCKEYFENDNCSEILHE